NEFKIASQLEHPNLVRVLGHGVEKDIPYLVMEFVPGQSLDKQLKNQGPMAVPEALALFVQVANALDFIHRTQLIHRDVKPGNILIDASRQPKLADLGLIKDLASNSLLTRSKTGLGTFQYSAPEQFDDAKNVDLRCDIYALAASMYVTLTGKYPFGPGSQMKVLMHKLAHQFTPLSKLIENVSPALEQVIIRSLHPDPDLRPASIAEFLDGMLTTDTAKPVLTPKPPPEITAAIQERRGGTRHPVQVPTTFGIMNSSTRDAWPAQIMDISAGGLCLQTPRRFEANTLLNIVLPGGKSGQPSAHLVRTCWIKPLPDKSWLLGCLFVSRLDDMDLDQFLAGDLSTTGLLKKQEKEKEG
ncbi:MAG TPA: serine/threonine-protein kinase, partial [Gemmataceae bacterium]|nr:serine/threonine-protein kinase [Gemmataceae bacterium]